MKTQCNLPANRIDYRKLKLHNYYTEHTKYYTTIDAKETDNNRKCIKIISKYVIDSGIKLMNYEKCALLIYVMYYDLTKPSRQSSFHGPCE